MLLDGQTMLFRWIALMFGESILWKDFAAAMGAYGRADLQAKYGGYAEAKIAELRSNSTWYSGFGLHALAEVAASGLLNSTERKAIVEKEFLDRVNRLSLDPFCQLFIIQAMARMTRYDDAFSSIRDLWGGRHEIGGDRTVGMLPTVME